MRQVRRFLLGMGLVGALSCAFSQSNSCPRFPAGSTVRNPPNVYSHDGTLTEIYFLVLSKDNFQVNGSQPVQAMQGNSWT